MAGVLSPCTGAAGADTGLQCRLGRAIESSCPCQDALRQPHAGGSCPCLAWPASAGPRPPDPNPPTAWACSWTCKCHTCASSHRGLSNYSRLRDGTQDGLGQCSSSMQGQGFTSWPGVGNTSCWCWCWCCCCCCCCVRLGEACTGQSGGSAKRVGAWQVTTRPWSSICCHSESEGLRTQPCTSRCLREGSCTSTPAGGLVQSSHTRCASLASDNSRVRLSRHGRPRLLLEVETGGLVAARLGLGAAVQEGRMHCHTACQLPQLPDFN